MFLLPSERLESSSCACAHRACEVGGGRQASWAWSAWTGLVHSGSWLWRPCGLRLLKPPPRNCYENCNRHCFLTQSTCQCFGHGSRWWEPNYSLSPRGHYFRGRVSDEWASLLPAEPVCGSIKLRLMHCSHRCYGAFGF